MNYKIISGEMRHMEQVLEIENACFSTPFTREQLLSQMPDEQHVFLVAESDGEVLGYVGMMTVLDEGYISNVAVSPQHRREGVGDCLISALLSEARKRQLSFVTLEVRETNAPARELYKKHGFADVGQRKNYYTKPTENAILMTVFL